MNINELLTIKTVNENEQQTRYTIELKLFTCVQQGNISKLIEETGKIKATVVTGIMSNDSVMQYKYMAVSTITLATRYAIQGGLNEKTAYDFSDGVITEVDSMESREEIINCLAGAVIRLTDMVKKSKLKPSQSPHIRKCICYINENINEKIKVSTLSEICGISPDYLSQLFKDEMGENLSSYISGRKLETAKELILQGKSSREIYVLLGFSSPSHFITAFKKRYHMTPSEFAGLLK